MADYEKSAADGLDYLFDWSDWLQPGELLATKNVTVEAGITKDSDDFANGNSAVEVWLSGGTAGQTYCVTCEVTTNNSPNPRTKTRWFTIEILGACSNA